MILNKFRWGEWGEAYRDSTAAASPLLLRTEEAICAWKKGLSQTAMQNKNTIWSTVASPNNSLENWVEWIAYDEVATSPVGATKSLMIFECMMPSINEVVLRSSTDRFISPWLVGCWFRWFFGWRGIGKSDMNPNQNLDNSANGPTISLAPIRAAISGSISSLNAPTGSRLFKRNAVRFLLISCQRTIFAYNYKQKGLATPIFLQRDDSRPPSSLEATFAFDNTSSPLKPLQSRLSSNPPKLDRMTNQQ